MNDVVNVLEVPISTLQNNRVMEVIFAATSDQKCLLATPNNEILLEADKNQALRYFLQTQTLNVPDSHGVIWAMARSFLSWSLMRSLWELICLPWRKKHWQPHSQVIAGSDLYVQMCERAQEQGWSVFLLGGQGVTPDMNFRKLQCRFPKLRVVGYGDYSPLEKNDHCIQNLINKCKPDIVFVAYGCPRQELWLQRNMPHLISVRVGIGIGGSFDFVAGTLKRAPKILQGLGLEWWWRLCVQPSRWGRIFRAVVVFPWVILFGEKPLRPPQP